MNRFPALSVVVWYLCLGLLGLLIYPLLRLALPGLSDRGYPMARLAGLLLLSYLVWLAGSARVPFTRLTISLALGLMALLSAGIAVRSREELRRELTQRHTYFLLIELLTLAFFLFFLMVRVGNPDLWHPWKGGEKPMDFSYFNAVLKSTSFPAYDPWYAGGYLNYYYYGFVMVGVLAKWLGITPAVAYNLILPSLFAMIAMGAFSIAWNLFLGSEDGEGRDPAAFRLASPAWIPGLAGALGMALLGNLGTVRMIFQGLQRLVAPDGVITEANLVQRWVWAFRGFIEVLKGANLPYGVGDWYWIPSRAIPALGDIEPITEFPYFTALYADLHAHLMALPITLLALAFPLSLILGRGRLRSFWGGLAGFALGGLAIGALRPTNTWDFPVYLMLGLLGTGYAMWRHFRTPEDEAPNLHPTLFKFLTALGGLSLLLAGAYLLKSIPSLIVDSIMSLIDGVAAAWPLALVAIPIALAVWARPEARSRPLYFLDNISPLAKRVLVTTGSVVLLAGLSMAFFLPFSQWYALGYTEVRIWEGTHTPPSAYFTHWGLFLFLIISWLAWETRQWMASTPLSSLRKLSPHRFLIQAALLLILFAVLALYLYFKVQIAWLALPLAAWAGALLLRPRQKPAKLATLFMIGTALVLTLMVEVIVLVGDIGRMNTVFKFYLQAWTLLSVSAAASLGWLIKDIYRWRSNWRSAWWVVLTALALGAALYPLLGSAAKIKDRIAPEAPRGLDGLAYMKYATYYEEWGPMDLNEDYHAIRWMQENVAGSPVIVEANRRALYRWGSRYSINTGLPGVVGWEWHQQQQRGVVNSAWVSQRIAEIDNFYLTTDWDEALDFLHKYDVRYIIVGQQERGQYPGSGLGKFEQADGLLWRRVYQDGSTAIYAVTR